MKHPYFEDVDFNKLESFEEAENKVTETEKEYIKITKELESILDYQGEQPPIEKRKKVYDEKIKPFLTALEESKN